MARILLKIEERGMGVMIPAEGSETEKEKAKFRQHSAIGRALNIE
jgi:hypothetical protein